MIKLEEYKGLSIEDIMELTGLPNRFPDQSKYSLARQKELLLKDAKVNNVLHLVKKTNPKEETVLNISIDKDLTILTKRSKGGRIEYTSVLDLNSVPHKVVREKGYITITVKQKDIPSNVIKNPKPGYVYDVIGIFTRKKCFYSNYIYGEGKGSIGSKYTFGFGSHVSLIILK